jgi:hypothetical protein
MKTLLASLLAALFALTAVSAFANTPASTSVGEPQTTTPSDEEKDKDKDKDEGKKAD